MWSKNSKGLYWARWLGGAMALVASSAALAATGAQGRGYGLNVTANVAVVGLSAPLGDTLTQTAPPDFSENQSVATANVTAAPVLTLTTDTVSGSATSKLAMNQIDASGGVEKLNLNAVGVGGIGLVTLTADTVRSEAHVRCSAGAAQASGTTTIENLRLNALGLGALTVNGTPSPNTALVNLDLGTPAIPPLIPAVKLASLKVVLNEQSTAGGIFSVNALSLHLDVLSLAVIDTVIGHSEVKLNDCAAPSDLGAVTISVPDPINAGNQASVPVTGRCTPGSASNVMLLADSTPPWNTSAACQPSGTYGITADASGWADGSITFTAEQDAVTAQKTVTKNTGSGGGGSGTPPVVTITTAADPINAANQASYAIGGACSENSVPVNLLISSGGSSQNPGDAACSGGAWTATANTTTLPDGAVTINASQTTTDGTGTATKVVTKNTATPAVTVYPPLAVNQSNVGNYSISGSCSENGQPVTVTLGDGTKTVTAAPSPTCTGGQWTASGLNASTLDDGAITATASQTNGNGTGTDSKDTQKDVTSPTVTVIAPPIDADNEHGYQPSGTCAAGDGEVTVTIGNLPPITASCQTDGTWTAPPTDVSTLPKGDIVVTASQTDDAGNTGTDSATTTKSTAGSGGGGGSGSIAPVPVNGLWAGLLLLVTGLGVLRRSTRRQS